MNKLFKALVSGTTPAFLVTGGLTVPAMGGAFPPSGASPTAAQPTATSAATASAPAMQVPADFPRQYAAIRQQLASDDFAQRETGQKALNNLSPDLLEPLQALAAEETDPEVRARLDMRMDAMVGWRLTHPPPLSVDFKDASLADIVAELNRQLGAPLLSVRSPADADRFTVVAHNQPLMQIIAALNRQSPLSITGTVNAASAGGFPTLHLARGVARDLNSVDNFALATQVTGQTGSWRVVISGVSDPRIRVVQIASLHIDKIIDQDGRSLLPAVTSSGGLTSGAGRALVNWTSIATIESVPGVQSIKELRGSITVSVLEKEETAVFDLTKQPAPVNTPHGVLSVTPAPGAGGIMTLHLDPADGAAPAAVALTTSRFILTVRSFDGQNKLVSTSMVNTSGGHVTMGMAGAGGATRLEVTWAAKTRDVVIPVEARDLPMPALVPMPAVMQGQIMDIDGIRR